MSPFSPMTACRADVCTMQKSFSSSLGPTAGLKTPQQPSLPLKEGNVLCNRSYHPITLIAKLRGQQTGCLPEASLQSPSLSPPPSPPIQRNGTQSMMLKPCRPPAVHGSARAPVSWYSGAITGRAQSSNHSCEDE